MRVYIIEAVSNGFGKLSQEGYDSLEKLQAFIENRSGKPRQGSLFHYQAETARGATDYLIHDVLVR